MESHEIPEDQGTEFVNKFSQTHVGWPVTIDVLSGETGVQHVAQELPLMGISFDTRGTRPARLDIAAGDQPDQYIAHSVDLPLHIRIAEIDPAGAGTIEIEPAQGPLTLVDFHPPTELPDQRH